MADFYAARDNTMPPLPWPSIAPPFTEAPVIAATDYVRAVPQMIAQHISQRFVALGTDGFGRSDQRANLRTFFEMDRQNIALAAIEALVREGKIDAKVQKDALKKFGMNAGTPAPWTV